MPINRFTQLLLDQLETQENKIAKLYETISGVIPSEADFWRRMSREEEGHAAWIRGLQGKVSAGQIVVNPGVLRLEELKKWERKIDERITQASKGDWTMGVALAVALEIEQAVLERPFLTVFVANSKETQATLENFMNGNAKHVDELKQMAITRPGRLPMSVAPDIAARSKKQGVKTG